MRRTRPAENLSQIRHLSARPRRPKAAKAPKAARRARRRLWRMQLQWQCRFPPRSHLWGAVTSAPAMLLRVWSRFRTTIRITSCIAFVLRYVSRYVSMYSEVGGIAMYPRCLYRGVPVAANQTYRSGSSQPDLPVGGDMAGVDLANLIDSLTDSIIAEQSDAERRFHDLRHAIVEVASNRQPAAASDPTRLRKKLHRAKETIQQQQAAIEDLATVGATRAMRSAIHAWTAHVDLAAVNQCFQVWLGFGGYGKPPTVQMHRRAVRQLFVQQAHHTESMAVGGAMKLRTVLMAVHMHALPAAFWRWSRAAAELASPEAWDAQQRPATSPSTSAVTAGPAGPRVIPASMSRDGRPTSILPPEEITDLMTRCHSLVVELQQARSDGARAERQSEAALALIASELSRGANPSVLPAASLPAASPCQHHSHPTSPPRATSGPVSPPQRSSPLQRFPLPAASPLRQSASPPSRQAASLHTTSPRAAASPSAAVKSGSVTSPSPRGSPAQAAAAAPSVHHPHQPSNSQPTSAAHSIGSQRTWCPPSASSQPPAGPHTPTSLVSGLIPSGGGGQPGSASSSVLAPPRTSAAATVTAAAAAVNTVVAAHPAATTAAATAAASSCEKRSGMTQESALPAGEHNATARHEDARGGVRLQQPAVRAHQLVRVELQRLAAGRDARAAMGMGADMYSEGMAAHLALRQRQVGTAQGISGRGAPSGTGGAWAVLAAPPWQAAAAAASAGATLAARPGARASNVRARIGVVPRAVTSPAMSAASAMLLGTSAHAHAHAQWG